MVEDKVLTQCDNCQKFWDIGELDEYRDFWSRVDIGGEVPAGDCPDCGAFAYIIKEGLWVIIRQQGARENPPLFDVYRDDDGYPHTFDTEHEAWKFVEENLDDLDYGFFVTMLGERAEE